MKQLFKKPVSFKLIQDNVFRIPVYLYVGDSMSEIIVATKERHSGKFAVESANVSATVRNLTNDNGSFAGMLVAFERRDKSAGTVAHEVTHVIDYVFPLLGIKDTESRAYYAQFLVNEINNFFRTGK